MPCTCQYYRTDSQQQFKTIGEMFLICPEIVSGKGMVKRETGAIPVRTRHCDKGVWIQILVTDVSDIGKAESV